MRTVPETDRPELVLLAELTQRAIRSETAIALLSKELAQVRELLAAKSAVTEEWANGFKGLQDALAARGLKVGIARLKLLKESGVIDARNVGTDNQARWRFNVGDVERAISQFEELPIAHQRRVLRGN